MKAIATLGEISFLVGEGLRSISEGGQQNFAQHRRLEGKPTLQQVGGQLDTINLDLQLHPFLTENPTERLQELKDIMDAAKPQSLVINEQFKGLWVIDSIDHRPSQIDVNTGAEIIECKIKLLEYVGVIVVVNEPTADRTVFRQPAQGPVG
jgi:phage protein U